MFRLLLITLVITLIGCSQGQKTDVSLQVSSSFLVTGMTGGANLYLINRTLKTQTSMVLSDNEVTVKLMNGKWDFVVIGWMGTTPFTGTLKCAKASADINGNPTIVELGINSANCNSDFFSNPSFRNAGLTNDLNLHQCLNISSVAAGSNCNNTLRGLAGSYRIKMPSYQDVLLDEINNSSQVLLPGLTSNCIPSTVAPSSLTSPGMKIPAGSIDFAPSLMIEAYEDTACVTPLKVFSYPKGLNGSLISQSNAKIFNNSGNIETFLEVGKLSITGGLTFPSLTIGNSSTQTITISNYTPSNISTLTVLLTSPYTYNGGTFPGTGGTCTTTLSYGSSCTLSVKFTPTMSGPTNSALTINFNNGQSQTVSTTLTGTGLTPANLSLSSGTLNYGGVIQRTVKTKSVTITNLGQSDATSLNFGYTGTDATRFSTQSNTCTGILNAGNSCQVDVKFFSELDITHSAVLNISYNDGIGTQSLTINLNAITKDLFVTDGQVNASLLDGNTLYIGGSFFTVGTRSGAGAMMKKDNCTGLTCLSSNYGSIKDLPKVIGTVTASVPDGTGGYYIGGKFTQVGSVIRNNLAKINFDGTVDASFIPNVDGEVKALLLEGTTLYLGGSFSNVLGLPRQNIASINLSNNTAVTGFNPGAASTVTALAFKSGTLYLGGFFTSVGGQARERLAAVDALNGAVKSFNGNADNFVNALIVDGTTLYVGGTFYNIGGQPRTHFAAFDINTDTLKSFNPSPSNTGYVNAFSISGTTLYVGGGFTSMVGQTRKGLAAFDLTTETLTSFAPTVISIVNTLANDGTNLYAGGSFLTVNSTYRYRAAAVKLSDGSLTSFDPKLNQAVNTISASASSLFVGGTFSAMGTLPRRGVAALDITTGEATTFAPEGSGSGVNALALNGTTLYVGGSFPVFGGQLRNNLAAIDTTSGAMLSFNPNVSGDVHSMILNGTSLYIAGAFTIVGGSGRNRIAEIDASSGSVLPFNPDANGIVYSMLLNGNLMYLGGSFTSVGGMSRNNLAAVDISTSTPTSFDPSPNNTVRAMAIKGSDLYVGGLFTIIGGVTRNRLAAIDTLSLGTATAFDPNMDNIVYALSMGTTSIVAGGTFNTVKGQSRIKIADINLSTGAPSAFIHNTDTFASVFSITRYSGNLYFGGNFRAINNEAKYGLSTVAAP